MTGQQSNILNILQGFYTVESELLYSSSNDLVSEDIILLDSISIINSSILDSILIGSHN